MLSFVKNTNINQIITFDINLLNLLLFQHNFVKIYFRCNIVELYFQRNFVEFYYRRNLN